jgi:trans-2,3-dihydro-3-hydroxyanthranilate isomerase
LEFLSKQVFDFARIRENFGKEQIVVFCFFSDETIETTSDLHARGLAPNIGIDEDPFTGSMQAGLVYTAKQNGYIEPDKQLIITEQGHCIGRPGFAEVSEASPGEVIVTASAVHVFSTKMELNA